VHYPRVRCPHCFSPDLTWHRVDPVGTIYAFTVTHRPTAPMFADDVPQAIAIVELTNGVRMTTTLMLADADAGTCTDADTGARANGYAHAPAGASRRPRVGDPVRGVFERVNAEITLLRFAVVTEQG
jgi:uncharacterized OB-fold protein